MYKRQVLFLSSGLLTELAEELMRGGYGADTPAAIVYRATWEDEKKVLCTVGTLEERAAGEKITKTALIIVGNAVSQSGYALSKLYDPCLLYTSGAGDGAKGVPLSSHAHDKG